MNVKRTDDMTREAICLAGDGMPMEEIGERLGVCRKTVGRWLADPMFRAEIAKQRRVREQRNEPNEYPSRRSARQPERGGEQRHEDEPTGRRPHGTSRVRERVA